MLGELTLSQQAAARSFGMPMPELIVRAHRDAPRVEPSGEQFVATRMFA